MGMMAVLIRISAPVLMRLCHDRLNGFDGININYVTQLRTVVVTYSMVQGII